MIYALVQLLRVVKAHGIGECSLIGFTFPKLTEKTMVTKVTVSYSTDEEKFESITSIIKLDKIQSEITSALQGRSRWSGRSGHGWTGFGPQQKISDV